MKYSYLWITSVLYSIFMLGSAQSQDNKVLVLVGNVIPKQSNTGSQHWFSSINYDKLKIELRLDGSPRSSQCDIIQSMNADWTCVAKINNNARFARVEVSASGFKKYSRNIILQQADSDTLYLNIGKIELSPLPIPVVAQITLGSSEKGLYRFRLTIYNPLQQNIIVKRIKFDAERRQKGIDCNRPAGISLKIEDNFYIVTSDEKLNKIKGSFRELTDSSKYVYEVKGIFKENYCTGVAEVSLDMPTDFILHSNDYNGVDILVPEKFRVFEAVDFYGNSQNKTNLPVNVFRNFTFHFLTSLENDLEFTGYYSYENP